MKLFFHCPHGQGCQCGEAKVAQAAVHQLYSHSESWKQRRGTVESLLLHLPGLTIFGHWACSPLCSPFCSSWCADANRTGSLPRLDMRWLCFILQLPLRCCSQIPPVHRPALLPFLCLCYSLRLLCCSLASFLLAINLSFKTVLDIILYVHSFQK